MALPALARTFINRFQGGVPVVGRPFDWMAGQLGCTADDLLSLTGTLLADGFLSRFGPIYDASRLGGSQTLAALTAPDAEFDRVAAQVNELPAVAHNYRREHLLNMWFVVATPTASGVAEALKEIEHNTGLRVYNFPKQHEFYLGLWLRIGEDGSVDTVPVPAVERSAARTLEELDFRIIKATQSGLPLVERPLEQIAHEVGAEPDAVIVRIEQMQASGVIRRIGAVPNHYRLGLRSNGMTVWDVPDEMAVELGEQIGALEFVSHSYLRPRYTGVWPYNLFAMVHGNARTEVNAKAEHIASLLSPHCRAHDVLFSSKVLKKTGLRLAA